MKTRHTSYYVNVKKVLRKDLFVAVILSIVIFGVYILFLSNSVFGGDSGDFLSAIAVAGIPHPSGYPLYVLFGILLSFLPIDATLAWKVGLSSALFSALSIMFVYLIVLKLWKNRAYALITSLTLAFTFPFWLYAEITEVLALQHLFITAILYFSILYRETKNTGTLYLIALLYGLSLTNNQTMLLFLPVVFILVIKTMYKSKSFFKKLLYCIAFFVLGLLPYIYLPIAASFSPPVNWGNPVVLENFLRVVTRQDYGWTPTSIIAPSTKIIIVSRYLSAVLNELIIVGVILCLAGFVYSLLVRKYRFIIFIFLLGFFLLGPFFFYYGASPSFGENSDGTREKFYASSIIFLILLIPFGIEAISSVARKLFLKIQVAKERIVLYQKAIAIFFFILPLTLFFKNVQILNLRDSARIAEVFAEELLVSLPKNTVLIARHDNVLFPVRYVEYGKGIRSDVYAVPPHEFVILAKRGLLKREPNPIVKVLKTDTDPDSYIHNIALQLSTPVVVSESDYHSFVKDNKIILYPHGLVLKYANDSERNMSKADFLRKQNAYLDKLSSPRDLLSPEKKERLLLLHNIPLFYSHAYTKTGFFILYAYKDYSLAREYFQKAIQIDDRDHWAYEGLGITYYQQKNYKRAQEAFRKAVAIEPLNHNAYFLLYGTTLALKDKVSARELERFFKQYGEIYTDFKFEKTRVRVPR